MSSDGKAGELLAVENGVRQLACRSMRGLPWSWSWGGLAGSVEISRHESCRGSQWHDMSVERTGELMIAESGRMLSICGV